MSRLPLTGGCNCGAVRFEVSAPLVAASYCRPSVRQFVSHAAPWEPIPEDGLPRHPESRHGLGMPHAPG